MTLLPKYYKADQGVNQHHVPMCGHRESWYDLLSSDIQSPIYLAGKATGYQSPARKDSREQRKARKKQLPKTPCERLSNLNQRSYPIVATDRPSHLIYGISKRCCNRRLCVDEV